MNRKHVACIIAGLLATTAFTASAQTAAASAEVAVDAQSAEVASDQHASDQGMQPAIDRLCPRSTGSRIVARADRKTRCTTFGRVYTQEDIQLTGAVDLADALRKLDPSIR